jgi:polar amino acid transport system substrate-binding protein
MKFREFILVAALAAAAGGWVHTARAEALDDIIKRGKLLVAIDIAAPPFGIQNDKMQPDGADVEVARLLAKDLGVELEVVPVTSANRIPYLQTKRVDLTMSTFSITPERAKAVNFSTPYGAINAVIFAPKSIDIKEPKDLVGKKVGVTRGTTNETDLVALAPQGTQIIRFDDEASTMSALASGQVDAYASGETIARSLIPRYPDKSFESKFVMRRSFYAAGMRRGEPDFLRWVDTAIWFHNNNGDLARIYEHWVGVPLPPLPPL